MKKKFLAASLLFACVLALWIGAGAHVSAATKQLALTDGSVMEVDDFTKKQSMVEVRREGTLYIIPARRVDFEKTDQLNKPPGQQEQPIDIPGLLALIGADKAAEEKQSLDSARTEKGASATTITNSTLKDLFKGQGEWVPGVVSDQPPRSSPTPSPSVLDMKARDKQKAGELEEKQKELDALAAQIRPMATRLQKLRQEHAKQDQLIEFVLTNGGNPNAVGGNVVQRESMATEIKQLEKQLLDLAGQYRQVEREIRWLHGPTAR
ncbi:hypothetical protein ACFLU6_08590 [Acidobacteriota bacterium]